MSLDTSRKHLKAFFRHQKNNIKADSARDFRQPPNAIVKRCLNPSFQNQPESGSTK